MHSLSKLQKEHLKQLLLEQQSHLTNLLKHSGHYGIADSITESSGELSNYDNHPADNATELFEKSKDLALNEHSELNLLDVNEALDRMDSDNYGVCIHCNQVIPYERLRIIPETHYCKTHSSKQALLVKRPIEEAALLQDHFMPEDAWKIVESWGNSDSPAMSEDREIHNYNELFNDSEDMEGYVEAFESFVATDIYGKNVSIVRNKAYREFMTSSEDEAYGEPADQD